MAPSIVRHPENADQGLHSRSAKKLNVPLVLQWETLGLILVIILVIFLLGGFSGRFGGYGYGGIGVILMILVVLLLMGRL